MNPTNRLAELIEDWKYLIRRDGLGSALPAIGLEIAGLPYRHLKFLVIRRSLCEPFPDLSPKIALEIRPFEQSDLQFVRDIYRPSEARQGARHLANGHRGLVALHQGQPAGYMWGCVEISPQTENVSIPFEPGDVLCTDQFTNPAFRGQGVQTALSLACFRMFSELGYRRAICYIETRNAPSLAVWQKKLGGSTIGKIDFLRIGAWYRVRYDGAAPRGSR